MKIFAAAPYSSTFELNGSVSCQIFSRTSSVAEKYLSAVPSRKKIDDVIDALCLTVMGKVGLGYGFVPLPKVPQEIAWLYSNYVA